MNDVLKFKKMHGSGNDFILIDNRSRLIGLSEAEEYAARLCKRKFGIGADGLILIDSSDRADFKWYFYNADGSQADMCGNGGRCAARFAYITGLAPENLTFETGAGIIRAEVKGASVKLQLPDPMGLKLDAVIDVHGEDFPVHCLNTGVPHAVHFTDDLETAPVFEWGRLIRHHKCFQPEGTNVDFVEVKGRNDVVLRTYERGVEDETHACGTGAVAAAILAALKGFVESPVKVRTWGGEILTIYFDLKDHKITNVFLEGDAVLVYSGILDGDLR